MISVILPAFNSEATLDEAIYSVISQDFDDYELIIVDDGSFDSTPEICQKYYENKHIKYIRQKNKGVSSSRNLAIKESNGDYIAFLDSDDLLDNNFFKTISKYISNYDVVAFGYKTFGASSDIYILENELFFNNILESKEHYLSLERVGFFSCLWTKVVKKSILSHSFNENIDLGEDVEFISKYLKNSQAVLVLNVPLYHYRTNSKFSLTKKSRENALDIAKQIKKNKDLLFDNDLVVEKLTSIDYLNSVFSLLQVLFFDHYRKNTKYVFLKWSEDVYLSEIFNIYKSDLRKNIKNRINLLLKKKYRFLYCFYRIKFLLKKVLKR